MTSYLTTNDVGSPPPETVLHPVVSVNTIGSYSTPKQNRYSGQTVTPYATVTTVATASSTANSTATLDTEELDLDKVCAGCGSPFHSCMEKSGGKSVCIVCWTYLRLVMMI